MSTTELHVIVCCSCVACEIYIWLCEIVVVTLATRAWRITRKHGKELERKWAGWQKRCIGPY